MNTTWTLATLLCVLAPPVESAKQPETLLYVRTTPSGAEIRLGGKLLGTSDDLFGVKSGNYKIVVDLEGHQPKEQKITVRDGRITRIELQLEKDASTGPAPAELQALKEEKRVSDPVTEQTLAGREAELVFGPVIEQTLGGPEFLEGEYFDIETGRRASEAEVHSVGRTMGSLTKQGFDMHNGAVGKLRLILINMAVYENPAIDWDTVKPRDVWERLRQTPRPRFTSLSASDADTLPLTCLFETYQRSKGVLQLVGLGATGTVKIRYKLVQLAKLETSDAGKPSPPTRLRHFVQIVVGQEQITYEGRKTSWRFLPAKLEKVPNRKHTVLAVAIASEDMTVQQRKQAVARAGGLARRFGFEYVSDVGVHPLGTKAEAPHEVPVDHAVIESIPKTPSDTELPELRVYPVTEAVAEDALTMLRSIVPKAQVSINLATRRLWAYGTPADHEKIKEAIDGIEKAAGKNKLVKYPVTPAQRKRFETELDTLKSQLPGVRVITDAEPGKLSIWAKEPQHKVVAEILAEILAELKREVPDPGAPDGP